MMKIKGKLLFDPPDFIEPSQKYSRRSDFEFIRKLGDGSFSHVWRVKHIRTKRFYAIKQIQKTKVLNNLNQFRLEVEILYKLSHPHIIKLFSHFEDDKCFYLIMELVEGGTLFHKLYKEKFFQEPQAAQFFREVALAVEFLHSRSPPIVHRDIKPENIMIDKESRVKLIDFGWATFVNPPELRKTFCGTSEYMSPEIVLGVGHSLSSDVWCLGVLLYEMLIGKTPFKSFEKQTLAKLDFGNCLSIPEKLSGYSKALLKWILSKDPSSRPSISEVKDSDWLKTVPPIRKTMKQDLPKAKTIKIEYNLDSHDTDSSDSDSCNKFFYKKKESEKLKEAFLKENIESTALKKRLQKVFEETEFEKDKISSLEKGILMKKNEILKVSQSREDILCKIFDLNLELEKLKGEDLNDLYDKKTETQKKMLEVNKEVKVSRSILEELRKKVAKESLIYANYEIKLQKLQSTFKNLQVTSGPAADESELRQRIGLLKSEITKFSCFLNTQQMKDFDLFLSQNTGTSSKFSEEIQTKLESVEERVQQLEFKIQELRITNELNKHSLMQNFSVKRRKILQKAQELVERTQADRFKRNKVLKSEIESQIKALEKEEKVKEDDLCKAKTRISKLRNFLLRLEKMGNKKRRLLKPALPNTM